MRTVGVRELKTSASRLLRRVRERGEEIQVTYRGQVVARIVPVLERRAPAGADAGVWSDLDRLAAEIGGHWPKGITAAAAVTEGRRDL
jgi:prevent-host-death family protein